MDIGTMPVPPSITQPALAAYAQAMRRGTASPGDHREAAMPSFGDLLAERVGEAVDANRKSESISIRAASGKSDLQDVVEAVNAAEISLQTVVSIRDRVISAYQEIMRMPI